MGKLLIGFLILTISIGCWADKDYYCSPQIICKNSWCTADPGSLWQKTSGFHDGIYNFIFAQTETPFVGSGCAYENSLHEYLFMEMGYQIIIEADTSIAGNQWNSSTGECKDTVNLKACPFYQIKN